MNAENLRQKAVDRDEWESVIEEAKIFKGP